MWQLKSAKRYVGMRVLLLIAIIGAYLVSAGQLMAQPQTQTTPAGLTITKTSEAPSVAPGAAIRYTITVSNAGSENVPAATVIDTYDPALIETVSNVTPPAVINEEVGQLIWNLENINPGANILLTYEAWVVGAVPAGIADIATTAQLLIEDLVIGSAQHKVSLEVPVLTITKEMRGLTTDLNGDGVAGPGDTVLFVLTYQNSGSVAANGVVIKDDYDETFFRKISDIKSEGADDGKMLVWTIGSVAAGDGGDVSYQAVLKDNIAPGDIQIRSTASIESDCLLPTETTNLLQFTVPSPTPTLTPEATALPTPAPQPEEQAGVAEFAGDNVTLKVVIVFGIFVAYIVGYLAVVFITREFKNNEEERSEVARVGFVVVTVVGAVLILAVLGGIESGAAAGILGTLAGYLLRTIQDKGAPEDIRKLVETIRRGEPLPGDQGETKDATPKSQDSSDGPATKSNPDAKSN